MVLAFEIGFHAENSHAADNTASSSARRAREAVATEVKAAVAGPFLGRAKSWRRVETWPDPDLGDPELAIELAAQLADYISALEPRARERLGRR